MNRADYLAQVEALHAPPELRARIAALAWTVKPRRRFRPWMGVCACLAVVILGGGAFLLTQGGLGGSGAGGSGHDEGATTFMSYAGPVFPLTLGEKNASITAERDLTLDFAPWGRVWVSNEEEVAAMEGLTEAERQEALEQYNEWFTDGGYYTSSDDILVTDSYTLTNSSGEEQTVTVLYPFASGLHLLGRNTPTLTLDGAELDTALQVGAYSGGFEGVWNGAIGGDPEGSVNLRQAESWEDYAAVLADGTYLANALGQGPDISNIPVTVYRFTEPYGPEADDGAGIPNPSIRASFDLDYSETVVLSWGFHAGRFDRENGSMVQGFSVPQPGERSYGQTYYLLVLGDDIENLTTGGYVTGGTDSDTQALGDCGVTVERYESDLDAMLREILYPEWEELRRRTYEQDGMELDVDFETWYRTVLEYLLSYGVLSPTGAERYGAGRLEDIAGDANVIDRVCWLEAELTIPAGESVTLTASMTKEASFDYACAHTENQGVKGYDLVTEVGSNLNCTGQSATLLDRGLIEIVRQNFGFDLENGITTVALDPAQGHYYLEVRRLPQS